MYINVNSTFKFRGVSISELKICINEIKNNADEYFLCSNVLLDAVFIIGHQLVNIINESFSTGIFPYVLKKPTIIPIQKVTGTTKISEFRPINMLPCVEKAMEKLAFNQLNEYVDKNKLLHEHQSGFRSKHSCETAINDILYEWKNAQNDSKIIVSVFLDLKRAFEPIDQNFLLEK